MNKLINLAVEFMFGLTTSMAKYSPKKVSCMVET